MEGVPDGCRDSIGIFDLPASPGGWAYRGSVFYSVVAFNASHCLRICICGDHFLPMSDELSDHGVAENKPGGMADCWGRVAMRDT